MWVTIIVWLVSFLLSYSKTKDAGKSALLATGAAAVAYYTVEPTNEDAIWGDATRDFLGMSKPDGDEALLGKAKTPTGSSASSNIVGATTQLGTAAIQSTADVAKSWGPAGTVGAITAAGLTKGVDKKWLLAGAALALFLLLK